MAKDKALEVAIAYTSMFRREYVDTLDAKLEKWMKAVLKLKDDDPRKKEYSDKIEVQRIQWTRWKNMANSIEMVLLNHATLVNQADYFCQKTKSKTGVEELKGATNKAKMQEIEVMELDNFYNVEFRPIDIKAADLKSEVPTPESDVTADIPPKKEEHISDTLFNTRDDEGNQLISNDGQLILILKVDGKKRKIGQIIEKNGKLVYRKDEKEADVYKALDAWSVMHHIAKHVFAVVYVTETTIYKILAEHIEEHGQFLRHKKSGYELKRYIPRQFWGKTEK